MMMVGDGGADGAVIVVSTAGIVDMVCAYWKVCSGSTGKAFASFPS